MLSKNTTQCHRPGLEPGPPTLESSTLTMRPPHQSHNFLSEKILNSSRKKIHGRSCTWNYWRDKQRRAVKWLFLGKHFILIYYNFVFSLFLKVQLSCVFTCFFICQSIFFVLLFFSAQILFKVLVYTLRELHVRTPVDKLLSGSMVTSHRQFNSGKQSSSLFQGNRAFQQNQRYNFSHFWFKTGLFLLFFAKVNCSGYENWELNIPFRLNEIYAIWTIHFRRCEFFN